jgi:hypothetical protein
MKKVKKFGRGGDILTALGAGLAGYGAYKYLTKDKDKDDDYTRRVKEYGTKGKFPEEKSEEKATPESKVREEDSPAKQRALRQSKDPKSNLVPEGADKDVLYESDKALTRTGDNKRKPVVKPKARPRTDTAPKAATSRSFAPEAAADKKEGTASKPYPIKSKPNEARASKTSPMMIRETADKNANTAMPKGIDLKGTNKTVYGTDTTSVFQKRAAKEREEKAKAEAEAEKKRRSRPSSEEMMTQSLGGGFKRGGAVKKYAAGGTTTSKPEPKKAPMPDFAREAKENRERDQRVKKEREAYDKYDKTRLKDQGSFKKGGMTASKRADGIAIRGKTRA